MFLNFCTQPISKTYLHPFSKKVNSFKVNNTFIIRFSKASALGKPVLEILKSSWLIYDLKMSISIYTSPRKGFTVIRGRHNAKNTKQVDTN